MEQLTEFVLGRWMQRFVINCLIIYICWRMGYDTDSSIPWAILILTQLSDWLSWQHGLFQGALGFSRLSPEQQARATKLFKQLEDRE